MRRLVVMSKEDKNTLLNAASVSTGPIIEIGSFFGGSSMLLAGLGRPLICIDKWEVACLDEILKTAYWKQDFPDLEITDKNFYNIFLEVQQTFKNIRSVRGDSVTPLTLGNVQTLLNGEQAGCCFIDGLHTLEQVDMEIKCYLPFVKTGGFFIFHDYHTDFKGVIDAVNNAVNGGLLTVVKPGYTTVCRKL